MIHLLTGRASIALAKKVAKHPSIQLHQTKIHTFSNSETQITFQNTFQEKTCFLLQSTSPPTNDHLMELLFIANTARQAGVKHIIAIIPYFGYAREYSSAQCVLKLLATQVDRIISVDLHSKSLASPIPLHNLYPSKIFLQDLIEKKLNPIIIAPDIGAIPRANHFAKTFNGSMALLVNKRSLEKKIPAIKNRPCVIIDDIVDSANTLFSVSTALKRNGAKKILAYVTHPVLSASAIEQIQSAPLDQLIVSDTIPLKPTSKKCLKINSLSVSQLLIDWLINTIYLKTDLKIEDHFQKISEDR